MHNKSKNNKILIININYSRNINKDNKYKQEILI
jgi:hypothetical protein